MKVELKDLSPVKKSLSIEAESEEIVRETDEVVRRYARQARIPGFRPGKVPLELVRSRFSKEIEDDVRERLVTRLHQEATRERGIEPLADPVLDDITFESGKALRFRTTFEVRPEFSLKEYKGMPAREPAAKVTDAEVAAVLEDLRRSHAKLITEEGRKASMGDVLVADVEGSSDGGGPFRRERVLIEVGATGNLPAFNDGLVGAAAGDVRSFPVGYPAEYENKDLAGKTVDYRITVHEVKRNELPELDDEFAKDLGEFESLAALTTRVGADLLERKQTQAKQVVRSAVLDKVLLENPIPLPEVLVDDEVRHRMEELVRAMVMQGMDPREMDLNWQELREKQMDAARKAVHARLVLDRIAQTESIQVGMDEVEARIRRDAERTGQNPREVRERLVKGPGLQAFQIQMVREKTLDFVTSVANIQRED